MNRQRRLNSARATEWVEHYSGKDIIKGYRRHFAVDLLCAIIELRALGVHITAEREQQIRSTLEDQTRARLLRRKSHEETLEHLLQDPDYVVLSTESSQFEEFYGDNTWEEFYQLPFEDIWLDIDDDPRQSKSRSPDQKNCLDDDIPF